MLKKSIDKKSLPNPAKMIGGPATLNLKILLILIATAIVIFTLLYTNKLVHHLKERERKVVHFFANGLEYLANSTSDDSDVTFLFENIISPIDFPIILTDINNEVNIDSKTDILNIKIDSNLTRDEVKKFLDKKISEMDKLHTPIDVKYVFGTDTLILTKIHYGESELITQLQYYPVFLILIGGLFIITGYIGFSQIKKTEQTNIWVGMAKETAHQLGTPLSSLLGWIEILKINPEDSNIVLDTADEMQNDIEKLNKIANRFSKIGSKPELKPENLYIAISKVVEYFKRRIPHTGKSVDITLAGDDSIFANINAELFEWVIENLLKNSLDAIDNPIGLIELNYHLEGKNIVIEIKDNGKGVDRNRRKDIFRPGYSTKRRGWGLGLSLSKRIIEEYHKGKIFVKSSAPNEGTTIQIRFKK